MMLRRTCFMNKRKEKKAEIDKTIQMVKQMIERTLKSSLSNETIPLTELPLRFNLDWKGQDTTIRNFSNDIHRYVETSN